MKIYFEKSAIKFLIIVMICFLVNVPDGLSQQQNIAGCIYGRSNKGGAAAGISGALISLMGISNGPTAISYDDGGFRLNLDVIPEEKLVIRHPKSGKTIEATIYSKVIIETDWKTKSRLAPCKSISYESGIIAKLNGKIQDANEMFQEFIVYVNRKIVDDPDDHHWYYMRGLAYMELKEVEYSKNDFDKALQLKPDYDEAKTALDALILRNKEHLPRYRKN